MTRTAARLAVLAGLATAATAAVPPRTVTLNKPAATLGDVLREAERQTGLTVTAPGLDPNTPCPIALDRTPFWTAVEQLATKAGAKVTLGKQGRESPSRNGPARRSRRRWTGCSGSPSSR